MKNILVPTDFSACATHAMDLGYAFAEFFNAKLIFYSCIDIPIEWSDMTDDQKSIYPDSIQLVKNTNVLFDAWVKRASLEGVELKTVITGGTFLDQLEQQVSKFNIDFVVMGSHGASGKNERFIGSNAQKAIRSLHVPIFIIKDQLKEYAFKNVIYASNFNEEDKKPFKDFIEFIKKFEPKEIHLLAINTSNVFKQPHFIMREAMNDFELLYPDMNIKSHFYRDFSVDSGIRHFSDNINADLIVISNHKRHPIKRIFAGSNVEALVNHCDIPILSIDYPLG